MKNTLPKGTTSGNSRNGTSAKTLKTDQGEIELAIPRDRKGEFDPVIVGKYQRTLGELEDKIILVYAKGMTTRDIQSHVGEIYPVLFLDAIHYKVNSDGHIQNKAAIILTFRSHCYLKSRVFCLNCY